METIVIKDIYGREIFSYTCEDNTIKKTVQAALMSGVDLLDANLDGADLRDADLRGAYLKGATLVGADLCYANLAGANLTWANLSGAYLSDANLSDVIFDTHTCMFLPQCPDGAFIGWKQAQDKIIKLQICEDAKRSSATSLKCRCSKAIVLDIQEFDGTKSHMNEVSSNFDRNFIYKIGEVVEVLNFNENRWNECSSGIHFFISREMAVKYF